MLRIRLLITTAVMAVAVALAWYVPAAGAPTDTTSPGGSYDDDLPEADRIAVLHARRAMVEACGTEARPVVNRC